MEKLDGLRLDFEQAGTFVAVRPSGTEPKVKYYMFAYEPAEQLYNRIDDDVGAAAGGKFDGGGKSCAWAAQSPRPTTTRPKR